MAARKDKSNTAGQFKKGDPKAKDCQLLSAASRSANADTHAKAKSLITGEDREAWITVLNDAAKKGDLNALKLLLQILKELPALGQTIDLHTEAMSDEDKALLKAVRERYDNA